MQTLKGGGGPPIRQMQAGGGGGGGLLGVARGAGDMAQRVGQVTAEVAQYARQRAMDLALEANGLVGTPAQEHAQDAYGQLLEQVRQASSNPITEGPMRRMADLAGTVGGMGAQLRPAPTQAPVGPLPLAQGGAQLSPLPNAPLGGPGAMARSVRPTLSDKMGTGY